MNIFSCHSQTERRLLRVSQPGKEQKEVPAESSPAPANAEVRIPISSDTAQWLDTLRLGEEKENQKKTPIFAKEPQAPEKEVPPELTEPGESIHMGKEAPLDFGGIERAHAFFAQLFTELRQKFETLRSQPLPTTQEGFHALAQESANLGKDIIGKVQEFARGTGEKADKGQPEQLTEAHKEMTDMLRYNPDVAINPAASPEEKMRATKLQQKLQLAIGSCTFVGGTAATLTLLGPIAAFLTSVPLSAIPIAGPPLAFLWYCAVSTVWFTAAAIAGGYCVYGYGKLRAWFRGKWLKWWKTEKPVKDARTALETPFTDGIKRLQNMTKNADKLCEDIAIFNSKMTQAYADFRMKNENGQKEENETLALFSQSMKRDTESSKTIHQTALDLLDIRKLPLNGGSPEDMKKVGFWDCTQAFATTLEHGAPEMYRKFKENHPKSRIREAGLGAVTGLSVALGRIMGLLAHLGEAPGHAIHMIIKGLLQSGAYGDGSERPAQGNILLALGAVIGATDEFKKIRSVGDTFKWGFEVLGNLVILVCKPTPLLQAAMKRLSANLTPDQLREEISERMGTKNLFKHRVVGYGKLARQWLLAGPVFAKKFIKQGIEVMRDTLPIHAVTSRIRTLELRSLDTQLQEARATRKRMLTQPIDLSGYAEYSADRLELELRLDWAKYSGVPHMNGHEEEALQRFMHLADYWEQVQVVEHLQKEIRRVEHQGDLEDIAPVFLQVHKTAQSASETGWFGQRKESQMRHHMATASFRDYSKKVGAPAIIECVPGMSSVIVMQTDGRLKRIPKHEIMEFYLECAERGRKLHILPFADDARIMAAEALLGVPMTADQKRTLNAVADPGRQVDLIRTDTADAVTTVLGGASQSAPVDEGTKALETNVRMLCKVFSEGQLLDPRRGLLTWGVVDRMLITNKLMDMVRRFCAR